MSKIAFIFPGQGSQYVGMGKDFYDKYPVCQNVIKEAVKMSGMDLENILFEENEEINITKYTQIAMLAVEVAILRQLEADGIKADVTAGLSLGEYAALVAAGALEENDAFRLVTKRGELMQEAVPTGGAMSAILNLDAEKINEICENTEGIVSVANYNCPGQIVITGEEKAVEAAAAACKEAGAKRCMALKVSGPFHSDMMKEAGQKLAEEMKQVEIHPIAVPYVTNVTADYVVEASQVKDLLERQISSSVKWQQSIERMIADGVDTFIEIGPKKSLTKFMKKINPQVNAYNIDTINDYENVISALRA